MCNLYRMSKSQTEVADFFRDIVPELTLPPTGNAPEEIYPGYPGLVLTSSEIRQMVWGFPLSLKSAKGQPLKPRPVNNARTDKLSGAFWADSFRQRRCLIPVSAWAEAEGPKGAMTRTWLQVPGEPLFAVAGVWRNSAEWGAAYSMVMTEACVAMGAVHNRMPVLLAQADWSRWLTAPPQDALSLCCPWTGELLIARTDQPWADRR